MPTGSQIAVEASGHYYWMVDEMAAAGHHPRLTHPLEAEKRLGKTRKKTDKLDANCLGILLRNGTLPEVWIPPAGLRDQRELLRCACFWCSSAVFCGIHGHTTCTVGRHRKP